MHIGEGTDTIAKREIDEVTRWNLRKKKIVAVHGVAMSEEQADSFYGLVWCPASNYFLLDQTAGIEELKNRTNIVFGTDSALTASWNLWEHIRAAKRTEALTECDLIAMLTVKPAQLWGLDDLGELTEGKNGDIIVVRRKVDFFDLNSEDILLVMHKGNISLYDESLHVQLIKLKADFKNFSMVSIRGENKIVIGDLPALMKMIRKYYSAAVFPVSNVS